MPDARVFAIWTRDENASAATGRGRIAKAIHDLVDRDFVHEHRRLRHLLNVGPGSQLWRGLIEAARGWLIGRRLPLQTLIYMPRTQEAALLEAIRTFGPDVVYLDSVRAAPVAQAIRRAFPGLRIVLDMDDLLSRRWSFYRKRRLYPGFGFLERYLPQRLVHSRAAAAGFGRFLGTESRRLLASEIDAAAEVDEIVFISPHEAALFGRLMRRRGRPGTPVRSIRPPVRLHPRMDWSRHDGLRFIFIGTDELPQNKRTIAAILDFWEDLRPRAQVHLYGRLKGQYRTVPGVRMEGFASDLEDVYSPGSILFTPSYVLGGVKTKVLEAFAHGCPVVGNRATFEGIAPLDGYPLILDEEGLRRMVREPDAHAADLARAAEQGWSLVTREYDEALFDERWRALLRGGPQPDQRAAALARRAAEAG